MVRRYRRVWLREKYDSIHQDYCYTYVAKNSSGSESRVSASRSFSPMLRNKTVGAVLGARKADLVVVVADGVTKELAGDNAQATRTATTATERELRLKNFITAGFKIE